MISTEHSMHHDETMKKRYLFIMLIFLSVSSILNRKVKNLLF
ncbi:ABC transporter permease [Bacillus cereus]|uniref:ABC transporter permease n=1 Tax=Bacillus tropicus TaxID=2026188 RepID=A0A5C5A302_9BACI|nr:Transport system permease protein [Bacillus cereus ATCC 4342]EEM24475.1 Transport system permease protein [Bacillus thuringiensis serovar tochigiensis BGSC 4Y1]KAA0798636.1 ABC transporter permease [Bacillus sp. JAS102]MDR4454102.1 ABC transporter permease [Bacillus tropicus]NIE93618.1 ABC transporter permease [Bacillus sp. Ab-1751]OOL11193.1 ABC transporter permease [Bacillus cereus]PES77948.1 ABC transporter permease [Bacillus anthracis]TXR81904.1 ABC transporter permease [Bacillus sp. 